MKTYVAFGSNLGRAGQTPSDVLTACLGAVQQSCGTSSAISRWFQTPAFPAGAGPDFVNGVVAIETDLTEHELMARLHAIEADLGRERKTRWAARVCDLDVIDYDGAILPDPQTYARWRDLPLEDQAQKAPDTLILPHPRVTERAFVLVPLRDVAPDWHHPVCGTHIDDLIAKLPAQDQDAMRVLGGPNLAEIQALAA